MEKFPSNVNIFNPIEHENSLHKEIKIIPDHLRRTSERITKAEYTEIISHRAKQIENGGPVYVDITGISCPMKMSKKEIAHKKCPLAIMRMLNTTHAEIWHINEMISEY